ncbi:capsular polysaccharide export protein, LipB/KpsS family [Methylobrevis albus]|uniref:Capsular biosynthesis protein n=1 Tax=Methylobrevis albus TaxID=2793297 RepID=A0A931HXV8_9HYPH|nr:capsular biosynthesis protein [Methylobrevis albus]MBH0236207.1 capsular biosynthesis protein [Methylobrevis albus]
MTEGPRSPAPAAPAGEPPQRPAWMPPPAARLGAWHWTRNDLPWLGRSLGGGPLRSLAAPPGGLDGVLGWGLKPLAHAARVVATLRRLPYWTAEDGLLRSVGLGKSGVPSISVVVDDIGIHIDARRPSRLERLCLEAPDPALRQRAGALRRSLVAQRLTKYNHLPDRPLGLGPAPGRRILLVDQVFGDRSIAGACADAAAFAAMCAAADAAPGAVICARVHPDVAAGYVEGYLAPLLGRRPDVVLIDGEVATHAVLDAVDEVWTVSSQMGFDALLRGMPVRCFGVPFYAGWGLTDDRADTALARAALARRAPRRLDLDDLVAAALIAYPLYACPDTGRPITPEAAVERLVAERAAYFAR